METRNKPAAENVIVQPAIKLDAWRDEKTVREMVEELATTDPNCFEGVKPEQVFDDLLLITDRKITFTHMGKTYNFGTSKFIYNETDQTIEIPAVDVIHGGELRLLLRAIGDIRQFLETNKNIPWLEHMSIFRLWQLASLKNY